MLKRIRKNMRNILLFKKFLNEEYGDDFDKNDQRENPKDKNIEKTEKPESDIPFIKSIGKDLTEMASNGKLDKVVGREKEIKQTAWILMQKKKNNPVLIGEPGVGKTAIVEGLAQLIVNKKSPRALWDKRIFSIDMGTILAGSKYKGQFEERMKLLITELENNPDIIIFIDEIHMLVTTGSESSNAANMLKPGLARGTVRCIGATTYNEYRESIEKDGALERRFNVVNVEQTSPEETLEILRNIKDIYEDFHLVNYSDDVLKACVKYSEKYMADKFFPDKAITLMDEVGAKMHLNDDNIPESIILLEEQIDELRKNKLKFLNEQDFDKAAEIREEEKKLINELSIEKQKYENESKTKRIDIKVDDIAEVLNVKKGIPTETLKEDEHEKLLKMETELKMSIIGQDEAIRKITKCIQRNRLGFRDPNKPVGVFLFLGSTGIGKTHVVKTLAKYLFGSEDAMFRFDMSEYQQEHEVARMKGCFTPDTEVTLSNGKTKKISEINLGDKVLTHLGNNKNVVDMYVYKHDGDLDSYKISNRNTLLNCTEQHEILAIKPNIYNKRIDKSSYNINNAKFYSSRDLKEGDILLYPKNIENCLNYNKRVIDMVDYVKDLPKYKYDDNFVWSFNDIKINRFIKIDVNFLRLAGYYLSEGGCTKNKKSIKFTFNINEKNYINETIKLLEIIFGTDIKIRVKNTLRHSTNIFVSSRIINIMLSDLFGRTCYEKKLPDFFMTIDKIMFHNFFETLFYGDGTKTLKRKMVYKTVSKDLSTQLNTLLKKFGYSSQFNEVLYKDRSNLRKIFNIILTGFNINKMNESLPNLKIGDIDIKPKNIQRNQYQDEDYYYYTILKKDKIYYKGPVYDISIEDDSTYITNGVSVHNSPPGYVGYGEGGQLTEKVRRKPNSIILLDEIEKANSKVYELFLQVFDDGVMTDGSGRKVDFKNTIIVMTSNVGTRNLGRPPVGYAPDKEKRQEVIDREMIKKELQRKFSPEFLNRIDDVIIFKSLDKESIFKIIDIELSKLSKNLQSKGLNLTVTDNFKHLLMEKGWNEKLGARPMKRAIQKYIEDVITKEWLKKTIKDEVNMDYDPNKKVILINNNPVNDEDLELNERVITKFSKFRRDRIKKNIRRKGITLRDRNDNNTLAQL